MALKQVSVYCIMEDVMSFDWRDPRNILKTGFIGQPATSGNRHQSLKSDLSTEVLRETRSSLELERLLHGIH